MFPLQMHSPVEMKCCHDHALNISNAPKAYICLLPATYLGRLNTTLKAVHTAG